MHTRRDALMQRARTPPRLCFPAPSRRLAPVLPPALRLAP
ncbi:Hypothetical protein CAP_6659 [Chondromyces apiculatus DSM 436]|uniref:Uncharacterized protein n=1 Tax=Chondromyces apiculatus DSM 436 TaxID=1192034 RepID=A0A017T068_9BACT|nr:Hypothetical protein CAP_6659 [Chondromyces apiculatus DSM 436]